MPFTMKSMAMTPQFQQRLASVNGVVIPSRVPQGEDVYGKRPSQRNKGHIRQRSRMTCIICDADCRDRRGLRDHFVVCAERNGNPDGARWDDPLEDRAAPAGHVSSESSSESQDLRYEDHQVEDYELDDVEDRVFGLEDTFPGGFDNGDQQLESALGEWLQRYRPEPHQSDSQLDGLESSSVQRLFDHHPGNFDTQPIYMSPNARIPYEPALRMDVLSNRTLISMVQDWQDLIDRGDDGFALQSPQFHELMSELVGRGLLSVDWRWAVDVDSIDMGYAGVMGEGLDV